MALPDQISEIVNALTEVIEEKEARTLPDVRERATRTYGLGSPEIYRTERETQGRFNEALMTQVADLLNQVRSEDVNAREAAKSRLAQMKLSKAGWAEALKRQKMSQQFTAAESAKSRAFQSQQAEQAFQRQKDLMKFQKKQQGSPWTKLLTNVALGAATGFVSPAISPVAGALMGGTGAGQAVGQYQGMQNMLDMLDRRDKKKVASIDTSTASLIGPRRNKLRF